MSSLLGLLLLVAVVGLLAFLVAWLRRIAAAAAVADLLMAGLGALAALVAASVFYGLSNAQGGSLALLASPLAATLALRLRSSRSMPRALFFSIAVVLIVVVWLTAHLKGPGGGWTVFEITITVATVATAIAGAACLGWWSKPRRSSAADRDTA